MRRVRLCLLFLGNTAQFPPNGSSTAPAAAARHLYGLKEVLYDEPYENAEQQTEYSGFTLIGERTVTDTITVEGDQIRNLFAMTPYFWKTPHAGALRLAVKQSLTTEIGFRFLAYRRV